MTCAPPVLWMSSRCSCTSTPRRRRWLYSRSRDEDKLCVCVPQCFQSVDIEDSIQSQHLGGSGNHPVLAQGKSSSLSRVESTGAMGLSGSRRAHSGVRAKWRGPLTWHVLHTWPLSPSLFQALRSHTPGFCNECLISHD